MWAYKYTDELYHHGILGMKWGVRRFQNKNGSLTAAGKKRRVKSQNVDTKKTKTTTKTESVKKKSETAVVRKSPKDMSDDELRKAVNRLQMEKSYRDYMKDLYPDTKSKGQKFVEGMMNKVIIPGATEAGKELVKKILKDAGTKMLDSSKEEKKK